MLTEASSPSYTQAAAEPQCHLYKEANPASTQHGKILKPGNIDKGGRPPHPNSRRTPDTKMQSYEYTPLSGPRHIRLLRILPSRSNQPIRCSIFEASLDDFSTQRKADFSLLNTCKMSKRPRFNALSYTWASSYPDTYIICNNQRIKITGNCELALRRFLKKRRGDPPLLPL
ncbi:hypothetical protein BDZ45DRAFT_772273 [Acephala macrosclerotiorum]|nr:hypothetical protein BDZ45DRAFT_772273 [Acephala macrosclerotiorum]